MEFHQAYASQVDLLLEILPVINQFDCFALKGGTAINLFIRDMPRLSVDIDLAYLPIEPRDIFLKNAVSAMQGIKQVIEQNGRGYHVQEVYSEERYLSKLIIHSDKASIKIEPNFVIRSSVFDCENHELCQRAQDQFLKYVRIKTLSFADLYGGKICAALARQHPRDLFDVKYLLDNQGLTDVVRQAFVIYLASSPRPMHELLKPKPNLKNFRESFDNGFAGMTDSSITHDELIEVRQRLIDLILKSLTTNERQFLLSLKTGEPDWSLISIPNIDKLPSIAWKLVNIKKWMRKSDKVNLKN